MSHVIHCANKPADCDSREVAEPTGILASKASDQLDTYNTRVYHMGFLPTIRGDCTAYAPISNSGRET